MEAEALNALLGPLGSLIGSFGGILVSVTLVNYRLKELEKKVDKHNNVVERVALMENNREHDKEDIEILFGKFRDLKNQ